MWQHDSFLFMCLPVSLNTRALTSIITMRSDTTSPFTLTNILLYLYHTKI